ncbi:hypothetical protein DF3PA_80047 [Candidatus Defluviicoccus seviourii]|uniref:Ner winged helix-turn-helix DNA-binding domain-containing protein n=1 Tax=Candidatus Defluviicoccus seviourii TaxID=2565273 RepID=A0A564WHC7_9PROT|nr:hypothetical protein DF3PA_80047 [Candidatus Defluviicoccus seviourii]
MAALPSTTPDWPWHRVVYELVDKAGLTLKALADQHGRRGPTIYSHIQHYPRPAAQAEIAAAIGLSPLAIWPTRYEADGKPVSTVAWLRSRGLPVPDACRAPSARKRRAAGREIKPLER